MFPESGEPFSFPRVMPRRRSQIYINICNYEGQLSMRAHWQMCSALHDCTALCSVSIRTVHTILFTTPLCDFAFRVNNLNKIHVVYIGISRRGGHTTRERGRRGEMNTIHDSKGILFKTYTPSPVFQLRKLLLRRRSWVFYNYRLDLPYCCTWSVINLEWSTLEYFRRLNGDTTLYTPLESITDFLVLAKFDFRLGLKRTHVTSTF